MERQLNSKRLSERPRRTPLEGRNRLSIKDRDPNYHYRIVNANLESDPERVEQLQEMGYEIVPNKKVGSTGDNRVDNPSALGSASQISVGQGTKAIVMRIPKEYFDQDQAAKQAENNVHESAAQKTADYGSIDITSTRGNR